MDDLVFKMPDGNGVETEYKVMSQFVDIHTGKTYVTYTEKESIGYGIKKVYAGILVGDEKTLVPIESEEEWSRVEDYIYREQTGVGHTIMVDESDLSPLLRKLLYGDTE